MEINPIFKIFESFPRQGPGDDEHTEKAFSIIAEPPKRGGEILDVGCGKGVQTMALARLCPSCRLTATDIHQPFLDAVDKKIAAEGFFRKNQNGLCIYGRSSLWRGVFRHYMG